MNDLDILEMSLEDEIYETEEVVIESVSKIKILAVIAASIALGALLIAIIKKIKDKKQRNEKDEEFMRTKAHDDLDHIQGSIEDEMKNLKEKREELKKILKDKTVSKEKRKEAKSLIKEVNKSVKIMQGFSKQVAELAKQASIPYDKINKLTSEIMKAMDANANIKFASESAIINNDLSQLEKMVYVNILGFVLA